MDNNISALRDKLFDQLDRLSNPKLNLDEENTRAACMVLVANSIIDTARVEIEFVKAVNGDGATGTGFFPQKKLTK